MSDPKIATISPTLESRFWSHVDRGQDCWTWTAWVNRHGYGKAWAGTNSDGAPVMRYAHRVAWFIEHGEWPGGLDVRHKCDNPSCVRPDHLELGTHQDNMRDMNERGRAVHVRGEKHGLSKLDADSVREIVRRRIRGESLEFIAAHYGVHYATIGSIVTGKTWSHVTGIIPGESDLKISPVQWSGDARGEKNNMAKLTADNVKQIFDMRAKGLTLQRIGDHFGVNSSAVHKILKGQRWPEVTGPLIAAGGGIRR
ncbi:HNH endonuclease signature motif containing protein [Mycobacterium sp. CnD-18-1]|uniref:HNH endonuclease signature motif containing protein n=1 Tax=Mycobacterium sp. CnD-18-1 TaxID=2917744 RepID=UPI001EF2455B|nr:HNH endonuclease signature motif containing protein [Mycobacterium sp. CnD-18-1]MCG7607082.1 HNH endonuclease [Mycobacterium sp. CnD-18-1]